MVEIEGLAMEGEYRRRPEAGMLRRSLAAVRKIVGGRGLTEAARLERARDRRGLPPTDPGIERAIEGCLAWLARAQDRSLSADGGVASHYSLLTGWTASYPETTGYIVPTLLDCARRSGDEGLRGRARRALDFLISIQLPGGGFQAGLIGGRPVVPVTFNTGQILLGLAAGVKEFGDGREAMQRAADWLVQSQEADGSWRRHPTPFAASGDKAYETHVAWGLLEASRLAPSRGYEEAALKNVRWAIGRQRDNGWIEDCCLTDPMRPLTHTLGYAIKGILEAHRFTGDRELLEAARRSADGLMTILRADGKIPGRLNADWSPAVDWVCLPGSVQISGCWLMLYQATREIRYREAAQAANRFVRRTMRFDGPEDTRGGIKGSFPVDAEHGKWRYLSWGAKFCIDAHLLELDTAE